MNALANQPTSTNVLHNNRYKFVITRLPNVNYFCNGVTLPGIGLGDIGTDNPFIKLPWPGDRCTFENLTIKFKLDETMQNYKEVMDWMISISFPDNFEQYKNGAAIGPGRPQSPVIGNVFSDASVVILSNAFNANIRIKFIDIFPVNLAPIDFSSTETDTNSLDATATFRYRRFILENIS